MMLTIKPNLLHPNLTVQAPPWDNLLDDPTATMTDDFDIPVDAFSSDNFRMYEFKVRKCARARSHDWTECPFAHPGEKARRRDPRQHRYVGAMCPDFKSGTCGKGDKCEYAHGVFECWLHPSRYRTQPCKDGTRCRRRVCFFAHTPDQLRLVPTRPGPDTPPMSPTSIDSVSELAASVRRLSMSVSPPGYFAAGPRFMSLPSTPTRPVFDLWEGSCEEEPVMERVESGRELRARMYAKLSKENSMERVEQVDSVWNVPDMSWITELVN